MSCLLKFEALNVEDDYLRMLVSLGPLLELAPVLAIHMQRHWQIGTWVKDEPSVRRKVCWHVKQYFRKDHFKVLMQLFHSNPVEFLLWDLILAVLAVLAVLAPGSSWPRLHWLWCEKQQQPIEGAFQHGWRGGDGPRCWDRWSSNSRQLESFTEWHVDCW